MLKATYFAVDPQFLNLLSNFSSVYRHNLSHAEVSLYLLKPDMHGAFMQYLGKKSSCRILFASIILMENNQQVQFLPRGNHSASLPGMESNKIAVISQTLNHSWKIQIFNFNFILLCNSNPL